MEGVLRGRAGPASLAVFNPVSGMLTCGIDQQPVKVPFEQREALATCLQRAGSIFNFKDVDKRDMHVEAHGAGVMLYTGDQMLCAGMPDLHSRSGRLVCGVQEERDLLPGTKYSIGVDGERQWSVDGANLVVKDAKDTVRSRPPTPAYHANLRTATRNCSFSVLGFWDENTGICAGAMPFRRDFPATTRI